MAWLYPIKNECREKFVSQGKVLVLFWLPVCDWQTIKDCLLAKDTDSDFLNFFILCETLHENLRITALGSENGQTLLDMNNASEESRIFRPVSLGKGLAPVLRENG